MTNFIEFNHYDFHTNTFQLMSLRTDDIISFAVYNDPEIFSRDVCMITAKSGNFITKESYMKISGLIAESYRK